MEHVVRRGDVEGAWGEWKVRAFREDDVSKSLRDAKFDHGSRDVDPDHADPALLERNGIPTRPDADLEDPLAVELVHEDREQPGHRPRCEAPRLVVNRRNTVEREAARHRAEHRSPTEKGFRTRSELVASAFVFSGNGRGLSQTLRTVGTILAFEGLDRPNGQDILHR